MTADTRQSTGSTTEREMHELISILGLSNTENPAQRTSQEASSRSTSNESWRRPREGQIEGSRRFDSHPPPSCTLPTSPISPYQEGPHQTISRRFDAVPIASDESSFIENSQHINRPPQKLSKAFKISCKTLVENFHLPRKVVERKLSIKRTTFTLLRSRHGITRWPYRLFRDIDNRVERNNVRMSSVGPEECLLLKVENENLKGIKPLIRSNPGLSRNGVTIDALLRHVSQQQEFTFTNPRETLAPRNQEEHSYNFSSVIRAPDNGFNNNR